MKKSTNFLVVVLMLVLTISVSGFAGIPAHPIPKSDVATSVEKVSPEAPAVIVDLMNAPVTELRSEAINDLAVTGKITHTTAEADLIPANTVKQSFKKDLPDKRRYEAERLPTRSLDIIRPPSRR